MVLIILSVRSGEISPLSNTSKPRRRGTRTSAILINSGLAFVPGTTSLINNLAALLPMSMAANLTMFQDFFCEKMVGLNLRAYFLFSFRGNVIVTQLIIQPSCLYIIIQLNVQNVLKLFL